MTLHGVGAFTAEGTLLRGCGVVDELARADPEPRCHRRALRARRPGGRCGPWPRSPIAGDPTECWRPCSCASAGSARAPAAATAAWRTDNPTSCTAATGGHGRSQLAGKMAPAILRPRNCPGGDDRRDLLELRHREPRRREILHGVRDPVRSDVPDLWRRQPARSQVLLRVRHAYGGCSTAARRPRVNSQTRPAASAGAPVAERRIVMSCSPISSDSRPRRGSRRGGGPGAC